MYRFSFHPLSLSPPLDSSQVTELRGMVEHQRYLRLQHLLERSTIYSRFMLKQMEDQKDKEKKEEEKRQKKNTNKSTKEKVDK
jgi:ATP-dependent DNA helicase